MFLWFYQCCVGLWSFLYNGSLSTLNWTSAYPSNARTSLLSHSCVAAKDKGQLSETSSGSPTVECKQQVAPYFMDTGLIRKLQIPLLKRCLHGNNNTRRVTSKNTHKCTLATSAFLASPEAVITSSYHSYWATSCICLLATNTWRT